MLSTGLNSNLFSILAGLLIPTTIFGLGAPSAETTFVAAVIPGDDGRHALCAYIYRGLIAARDRHCRCLSPYLAGVLIVTVT